MTNDFSFGRRDPQPPTSSEKIGTYLGHLKNALREDPELQALSQVPEILRGAANEIFYASKERVDKVMEMVESVLKEMDRAMEMAGGPETDAGRKLLTMARALNGMRLEQSMTLRLSSDGLQKPSSLAWSATNPVIPDKPLETLMSGLYDLADELQNPGGGK